MASPSVTLREEDLSSYVQSYSASQAGFAGDFIWGPVDYPYNVANEDVLVKVFGKPTLANNAAFYTVKGYLDYSDNQVIVRSVGSKAKNATDINKVTIVAQISNISGKCSLIFFSIKYIISANPSNNDGNTVGIHLSNNFKNVDNIYYCKEDRRKYKKMLKTKKDYIT